MKQHSDKQVKDWLEHPEKYDIATDENFARFAAWTFLMAERITSSTGEKIKEPQLWEVLVRVDELRNAL